MALSQAPTRPFWQPNARQARVHAAVLSTIAWRIGLCLVAAILTGWTSYDWVGARYNASTDFSQLWAGARALVRGESPYAVVGPGRAFDWEFPLLYPLPAVLLATPLAIFPLRVADAIFMTASAFALAWAVTRHRLLSAQWWVFGSVSFAAAVGVSQWSPLLAGATAVPALGFVFACKPTVGAALWCANPSRRALFLAAGFAGVSILVWPSWPKEWLLALNSITHMNAPIQHVGVGGPLVLLALLKWRRPEARLLAALACVPQSMFHYEALPLFLIVRRWYEGLALFVLSFVTALQPLPARAASYDAWVFSNGDHIVLWMYLPCLVAVLCRPNVSQDAEVCTKESGGTFFRGIAQRLTTVAAFGAIPGNVRGAREHGELAAQHPAMARLDSTRER
jgi:hypothetical protein